MIQHGNKTPPREDAGPVNACCFWLRTAWLTLPGERAFKDKRTRFHPALFEPVLREFGRYVPDESDAMLESAVRFARDRAVELDTRLCKFLDPSFDTGPVRAAPDTPFRKPWHPMRHMSAETLCRDMGCKWVDFCADEECVEEARMCGITIVDTSKNGALKRIVYMWTRKCMDARLDLASPVRRPRSQIVAIEDASAALDGDNERRANLHGAQNDLILADPLVSSIRDSSGRQLLAIRPFDGYVWVGTLFSAFAGKRHARFISIREHKKYMDLLAEKLGMQRIGDQPARDQLFKTGPSPFDASTRGWYAHIQLLPKIDRILGAYPVRARLQ